MKAAVRIATFNLENLDEHPRGGISFDDRLAVLRPQLERLDADILCLQEVNAGTDAKHGERHLRALDRLVAETQYAGFHRATSQSRSGSHLADRHNLVTLSRFPISDSGQHWHHLVAAPSWQAPGAAAPQPIEWDRPILHAVIQVPGPRPLHLINVHLRAPRAAWLAGEKQADGQWASLRGWAEGFFMAAVKQAGQALEVRLAVEDILDQDAEALVAVAGDFNAPDRDMAVRIIRGDEEDTGNGHLATRMLVPVDRQIWDGARFSVIHHGRPVMLDHILVSRPLLGHFRHAEVHNEALGDELVSPMDITGSPESYHAPLVAEFTL
jgi:endonuclease/exonuclease/phosphatase family metal-dependent hydrolase